MQENLGRPGVFLRASVTRHVTFYWIPFSEV
ncbi:protein of unknown function [Paraburkholderia dioscoreae]|uniref:Uncharacterized protein n=1 Tax=Paraburkholderia dioscoreae TaxID=2604047 RepID=A0A5Q4ZD47_9BURK|nr:protein of unknown function [Paraburkholderia dioscoreae]